MSFQLQMPEPDPDCPIRGMMDTICAERAREQAARLDSEAIIFLRMGFQTDELTMAVHRTHDPAKTHIVPRCALEPR